MPFLEAIEEDKLELCTRCHEKWFNMHLDKNDICSRCRNRDKNLELGSPFLMSRKNGMDPRPLPDHLLLLTSIEEMVISRVHVSMQVWLVRGQQYKYKGHICNFSKDTARIYRKLPLLPKDVDLVVLKPAGNEEQARRQFKKDFKVRGQVIKAWLY